MAEIIAIVMIVAAIVVVGIAWSFAQSRKRRGLSLIERTRRSEKGSTVINLSKNRRRGRSTVSDH